MQAQDERYQAYIHILTEELRVALGCTEPIALAYAAAKARELLGRLPERWEAEVCGNIIKNAKSVTVPNTGGQKGIPAAIAAGIVGGDSALELEVLSRLSEKDTPAVTAFLQSVPYTVTASICPKTLYIRITVYAGADSASVTIADAHTHIVRTEKNGVTLFEAKEENAEAKADPLYALLNVADIVDFAATACLDDFAPMIRRQVALNSAICEEGLRGSYGANIGKVILQSYRDNIYAACQATAAAGSDARMSGCELPVVIVSGSGNQGITASIPVAEYARRTGAPEENMLRAVLLSDLITIHQKTGIGKLSAYCGAVSAGVGAACGIAFLNGGGADIIAHTLVNAVAISSGIICDGAKPSCAAKIGTAVYAGLMGYEMYRQGQQFYSGEGIVTKGVENTIRNVGELAQKGMAETDREILALMTKPICS